MQNSILKKPINEKMQCHLGKKILESFWISFYTLRKWIPTINGQNLECASSINDLGIIFLANLTSILKPHMKSDVLVSTWNQWTRLWTPECLSRNLSVNELRKPRTFAPPTARTDLAQVLMSTFDSLSLCNENLFEESLASFKNIISNLIWIKKVSQF